MANKVKCMTCGIKIDFEETISLFYCDNCFLNKHLADGGKDLSLNDLTKLIRKINDLNGWTWEEEIWKTSDTFVPAKLMLVVTELTESDDAFTEDDKENFSEELSDSIIRLLDMVSGLGFNITPSIYTELEYDGKELTIVELNKLIRKTNDLNGCKWDEDIWVKSNDLIPAKLMKIVNKTSKTTEAFRKDNKELFVKNIAASIVLLFDMASGLNLDIIPHICVKLLKNSTRGHKHGGKRV